MENKQNKVNKSSVSVFTRISTWFFAMLRHGIFGHFFTSYDNTNERFKKIVKRRKLGHENRTKKTLARALEGSPFVKIFPKIQDFILKVSLRDYGVILFTMAILTGALYFVQNYTEVIEVPLSSLIISIFILVFSLPMLASKKPVASSLFKRRLPHAILFSFLGIQEDKYRDNSETKKTHSSLSMSMLVGLTLAVIGYFVGPLETLGIIGIIFLAYEVLLAPEIGIVVVILTLPFTSTQVMSFMMLYVTVCYIAKCVVGRRTLKFEYVDLWMVLVMIATIYGGFMSYNMPSSIKDMLVMICLLSSFFVISNLVRSKEWYRRCIFAICTSSTITSVIGLTQFVLGKISSTGTTIEGFYPFVPIDGRILSTFGDADSFAMFLVASLPFMLLMIFSGKSGKAKTLGVFLSIINVVSLALTYSKVGYIGALAMFLLLLLLYRKNSIYLVLTGIGLSVTLNYALPEQAIDWLSSLVATPTNSHAYRLELFNDVIEIIKARPFGIGIGQDAFSSAFGEIVGTPVAENSGNLYLQLILSFGLVGFVVFVSAIIVFLRLCFSYAAKAPNSHHRINALAGFCGMFGFFVAGFFGYIWLDRTIFAVFCVCSALVLAYIRIERESYNAPRSATVDVLSASIDIELDKDAITRDFIPRRKYVHISRRKARKLAKESDNLDSIKDDELAPIVDNEN